MGKINEITQKVELSFENNKYTTEIKDDVVEFDSNGLSFNFLDPVNVPSLLINGEEIVQSEPQIQSDWNQTDETAVSYILNRPAVRGGAGTKSIVEGDLTENTASGDYSHTEGYNTTASEWTSHAEGSYTTASGYTSHAEGNHTTASVWGSHAEGSETRASGTASHTEGQATRASGENSHAEGYQTQATMNASHAEGGETRASGERSHAEGYQTTASGNYGSHAEGYATTASGYASHAEGRYTTANHNSQHVFGEYNIADPSLNGTNDRGNYIEIVGNGAYANNSNARTLDWNGNEVLAGVLTCGGNIIASGVNINEALGSTQGFSGVKFRVISGSLQVCIDGVGAAWKTITLV